VFTATYRHGIGAFESELADLGITFNTPGPTTPKPAAKSNASTKPSSATSPNSDAPAASEHSKPNLTLNRPGFDGGSDGWVQAAEALGL